MTVLSLFDPSAIPPSRPRVAALSGNISRPSRGRALAGELGRRVAGAVRGELEQFDLVDAGQDLGLARTRSELSPAGLSILQAMEAADLVIVSVPVLRGGYPGLFKHLIDFLDPEAMHARPVILGATSTSPQDAGLIEHQLVPLFQWLGATIVPETVFAQDRSFLDFRQIDPDVDRRIAMASAHAARLLQAGQRRSASRQRDTA
ncbi:FMN reductase [Devosia enhydra]|uniref:FMN reductase n=1 Tax=Devosia enhydra TaxID=665118 RepID=A0A1K2HXR9_9HYPH|nr:NAD(P)H-dependent oxidoreductase [Devosia enhydra]SFZ84569.1 FMN reductase [Devosia enhydra]